VPLPALCPLITFSNHLKYLTRQGFPGLPNAMNLIMHLLKQISGKNSGEEVVEACKACMVVFSTYSLQQYGECVWFGQQAVFRLEMTPRRLGVSEEHLKSHCFSLPLHRTSCSSSTARTSSLLLQRVKFAFFHGWLCF